MSGHETAVATHDDDIISFTKTLISEHQIPREQFEFQMLYGIRTERQKELAEEGYRMRVYVPYGTDWYGYLMRRIAERPANAAFVLKGIFKNNGPPKSTRCYSMLSFYIADFGSSVCRRRIFASVPHFLSCWPRSLRQKTDLFSLAPFPSPPGLSFPPAPWNMRKQKNLKNSIFAIEVILKIF